MSNGLVAELSELIKLKHFAQKRGFMPKGFSKQLGNHLSPQRGRGIDLAELRNYQAGDEIRHMNWNATARTGIPYVECHEVERNIPVILLADFNPSMLFGTRIALKSVIAARLAALLAWNTVKQGDRIGGLFYSAKKHHEFTPLSRDQAVLPILNTLSQLTKQSPHQNNQPLPMQKALLRLCRVVKPGSIVACISDFYTLDEPCLPYLQKLCRTNQVLFYHICDAIELAPPKPGLYPITDGEEKRFLDTRSKVITKAYQNYCTERLRDIEKQCKRLQIKHSIVSATTDLVQLMQTTFPRRNRG